MDNKNAVTLDNLQIKVNFRIPGRMPSVYAHNMLIQAGEDEITLSFYEVILPPIMGTPSEEQVNALKEIGLVAECVARVTVAKSKFLGFAGAMQQIADQITSEGVEDTEGKVNADTSGNNQEG